MNKLKLTVYLSSIFFFIFVTGYSHAELVNDKNDQEETKNISLYDWIPYTASQWGIRFANKLKGITKKKNSFLSKLKLNGYLKNETAYRIYEPRSFTKLRNIVYLDASYPVSSSVSLTFVSWAYYDVVYDLFNYDTISNRFERESGTPLTFIENLDEERDNRAEIREFYVDFFLDNADIRIGKQYVIWGVLDGQRVVDEINPMDFRELILPDLLDFRIPLWTFKLDYFWNDSTFEFIWIPDIKFHKPAPKGSEWELLQDIPNTKIPNSFDFKNSEAGIKLTKNIFDAEISLSYFYTWDDYQVVFREVSTAQLFGGIDPVFFPAFTRIHMYGATFVRKLWRFILKGEAVYVQGKYFGTDVIDRDQDGFLDDNGELQRDHIRWGLGFDYNIFGFDISPSLVEWIILDYDDAIAMDSPDTSFAVFARKEFPNQSMVFQVLMIHLINMEETLLKPRITYNVTDRFQISTGMDLFYGLKGQLGLLFPEGGFQTFEEVEDRFQFIGNFSDSDRIYMEFKYNF